MIESNLNIATLQNSKFENLKNSIGKSIQEDESLRKVSDDFEAFFTQQMLDISLKSTKIAGGAVGSDIVKGMYTDAVSQASSGTFGISDMLYKFLSENNK